MIDSQFSSCNPVNECRWCGRDWGTLGANVHQSTGQRQMTP